MIKSIHLQNFFSFKDEKIDFEEGVNVFVGVNGSGKTNLFKAFELLQCATEGVGLKKLIIDEWGGFDNMVFVNNHECGVNLTFEVILPNAQDVGYVNNSSIYYTINISRKDKANYRVSERVYQYIEQESTEKYLHFENGVSATPKEIHAQYDADIDAFEAALGKISYTDKTLGALRKLLSSVSIYGSFDTTLYSKIRQAVLPTQEKKLLPNGSNLVALLNDLKQKDADAFKKIVEALHKVNENYVGVEFENVVNKVVLKVKEKELKESICATHLSDGTLCFLCLLSILYNSNRGSLVCMDEPELGLHPDMVITLANAIKNTAETSQLIVTTHSEHILDAFELENIRVVEKNEENATVVTKYNRTDFEGWYDVYLPGRMWRAGDIGGNRW